MNKQKVTILIFQNDDSDPVKAKVEATMAAAFDPDLIDIEKDIQVIPHSKTPWGLSGEAKFFAVPYLTGYQGIGIGIMAGITMSCKLTDLIYRLPPLSPVVTGRRTLKRKSLGVAFWDCEHDTSITQFSENNMIAVKRSPNVYCDKYLLEAYDFGLRRSNSVGVRFVNDIEKYFIPTEGIEPETLGASAKLQYNWWEKIRRCSSIWRSNNKGIS